MTAQFNFDPGDLDSIANRYIHLDHEQQITASGGISYLVFETRLSTDMLVGSGLRADLTLRRRLSVRRAQELARAIRSHGKR